VSELAPGQAEKKQSKNKVESRESNQRENRIAAAHDLAVTIPGVKEVVNEPRLAPQLGRHPAQRVGNVGEGKRQQQHPHARRSTGLPLISLPASKDFLCHRHHAVRLESESILELLQRR